MPNERPAPVAATIPVVEETLHVGKRRMETGQIQVALTTEHVTERLRETLRDRRVEVERVPVGRVLEPGETPPAPREEGDTLVIPVLEETAVLVKRLVVREEVRLRFLTVETPFEQDVSLRRQHATILRTPASPSPDPDPEKGAPT